jgi:hypothetical protein
MAVSIIDGTVEALVLKKVRQNVRIYERVTIMRDDGRPTTIAKAVVQPEVAALLEPGTKGRFYVYNAIDHRGIHGVRASDGRSAFAFSRMNERATLIAAVVGVVLTLLYLLLLDRLSLWGPLLILLGVPGYFLYRKTRVEAEEQYRSDNA